MYQQFRIKYKINNKFPTPEPSHKDKSQWVKALREIIRLLFPSNFAKDIPEVYPNAGKKNSGKNIFK